MLRCKYNHVLFTFNSFSVSQKKIILFYTFKPDIHRNPIWLNRLCNRKCREICQEQKCVKRAIVNRTRNNCLAALTLSFMLTIKFCFQRENRSTREPKRICRSVLLAQSASRVWHHTRYAGQSILQSVYTRIRTVLPCCVCEKITEFCSFNNEALCRTQQKISLIVQHVIHRSSNRSSIHMHVEHDIKILTCRYVSAPKAGYFTSESE